MKNLLLALLFNIFFAYPFSIFSQDGSIDNTFGNSGIVSTLIGTNTGAIEIQVDGKIVAVGSSYVGGSQLVFALTRYNINGILDYTFGNSGIVTTIIGNQISYATSIEIQQDGKIVAAGYCEVGGSLGVFALTRYNINGTLDNTFGNGGIVTTPIGTNSGAYSIEIQADGKILAAGYCEIGGSLVFALTRYNINGSLDNTFGNGGIVTTLIGIASVANSIELQADGKIVVGGSINVGGSGVIALTRYNTNGSLDNTFGNSGIVSNPIGTNGDATSIEIQADGKIVVGGSSSVSGSVVIALTRYNINGSLDNTFGNGGIVTTSIGTDSYASSIQIQADGKIVAAGSSGVGGSAVFALTRYNTNGSLDNTFGNGGIVTTPIGTNSWASSIQIQADGKIVAGGYCEDNGGYINLVRYNNSLAADISENSNITSQISICPNPFSNATTLNTNKIFENATFLVYNTLGEQVRKIDNISGQTFTFYRENLEEGIYFYQLNENNKILSEDKLIITD
jgi:uncharacterized delta-60 repeat protein